MDPLRPIRPPILVTLLLLTTFAGCLGAGERSAGPGEVDADGPSMGQAPASMELSGCRETFASVDVEPAEIRRHLPPGLDPALDTSGDADLQVLHWTCEATLEGHRLGEVQEVWVYTSVEPPEDLERSDANGHAYVLGAFAGDPATQAAYEAWGIPRVHLQAPHVQAPSPGSAGPYTIAADGPSHGVEATGELAPSSIDVGAGAWRFIMADPDGTLSGILDIAFTPVTLYGLGTANVELRVEGQQVPTQPWPGTAEAGGGEDFALALTYQALDR